MRCAILIILGLLSACGSSERDDVQIVLKSAGHAVVALKPDATISIEGKLEQTDEGDYVLRYIAGTGRSANRGCAILYGVRHSWVTRWKAYIIANSGRLINVSGSVTSDRFPSYPTPGDPQHKSRMCELAVYTQQIHIW